MFTGIIENSARVTGWQPSHKGGRLVVLPARAFKKIKIGESIAVNGCCLTVVACKNKSLEFDVSDETVRKTALAHYQVGTLVNLERAMLASDRFGGHFVLGHVDGVGNIKTIQKQSGSILYTVTYPKKFASLLIEKGSVTVDGISLTVCDLTRSEFSLYVIPHTLKETHLPEVKSGTVVNLEFDVLGKYVARARAPSPALRAPSPRGRGE